jgi:IMP dehydrogenase
MDTEKATVKDYMTKNVYTVRYDTLNKDVIQLMKETKHDGYPVVDENQQIVGIITAYDLLLKDWDTEFVSGIMSKEVIVAREDMHINDA